MGTIRLIPKASPVVVSVTADVSSLKTPLFVNNTGATLLAGAVAYIDAANSIRLAHADNVTSASGIGVIATDTLVGAYTTLKVGGVTNYLLEPGADIPSTGDLLFLSGVTPGTLSSASPAAVAGTTVLQVGSDLNGQLVLNIRVAMEFT